MRETQWMTLLETADLMKKLPTQVTRMCEDGKLEYYREDGRYFVSRESIDLAMHPRIGGPTPPPRDVNGTSRRKYGQSPDEFDAAPRHAKESETVNGRDTMEADAEDETDGSMEDTVTVDVETEETSDAAVERETNEDQEPVETQEAVEARQDAEVLETTETGEGESQVETEPEKAVAEPVDDAQRNEETPLHGPAGSDQPAGETDRDRSVTTPDESTRQAAEILADLREAVARQAAAHEAFCDEISVLVDALESTLSSGEDRTSELTREISSLLVRYTRR